MLSIELRLEARAYDFIVALYKQLAISGGKEEANFLINKDISLCLAHT